MFNCKSLLVVIGVLLLNAPEAVYGQFVVAPKVSQHAYVELIGVLYKQLAQELNEYFVLPHKVQLTSDECGQVNAFYVPGDADKPSQIVMCTELVGAIVRRSGAQATERTPDFAVFSQLYFMLLHEVGHALIDVLDLPVVGQEEDAVDQLATIFFGEEPVLAMWAATFWRQTANESRGRFISMELFTDEHDLNEQRFFNIVCWTYGADPIVRGFVAQHLGLPARRAQQCQYEYNRMRSGWEQLLAGHLRDPRTLSSSSPKRNVSGYWRFVESMTDSKEQVRCSASGTLALWQMVDQVSGDMAQEGSCVAFGVPTDNTASAKISAA